MSSSNTACRPTDGAYELIDSLLMQAHRNYDIIYEGHLANHLPHALYALCSLGASKSRLQDFYDMYTKRLVPLRKSNRTINSSNWTENIGNESLYAEYLEYFESEVNLYGVKGTFDLYYCHLMGESFGAALHPLIHIGYAMESSNELLLSEGLAYACIRPLKDTVKCLDDTDTISGNANTSVVHILEELQKIQFPEFEKGENFDERVQSLIKNHGMIFKNLIFKWDLTKKNQLAAKLNELTEASILSVFATYPKQIDFFVLHGLTGNHAVRIMFSHLPENMQRQLLRANLLGLLLDYVSQRKPKIDVNFITGYKQTEADDTISWDSVVLKAISINEEHTIKVVHSLIHYMEMVPLSDRPTLFSDQFIKRCAFKAVDLLHKLDDFIF